jgi:hypothetical protein
MNRYTAITECDGSFHLSQHDALTPEAALRMHIGAFPMEDGMDPADPIVSWFESVAEGASPTTLIPVAGCHATWLWLEGSLDETVVTTYVVQTVSA